MMSATNFREVDEMTGTDVTGGCTTKLTGVSFTVKQTEIADTPFQDNSPQVGPSLQGRMAAAIAKHQATLVQVGE
jgi:hypothetical protein